jgi:uncharacterized protein YkwD
MISPWKKISSSQQGFSYKTASQKVNFLLPGTLSLLIFSSLSIVPNNTFQKMGLPAFNKIAQAQTNSKFTVGEVIVVKLDDGYYFATVNKIYQKDGFTMLDFSWDLGNGGGGEGTFPADDPDLFSIAEAEEQNFTIVNTQPENSPAANANNPPPVETTPVVQNPQQNPPQTAPVAANNDSNSTCSGANQLTNAEIQEILRVHNAARAEVNVAPLKWNCKLADFAQTWVNKDVWEHSSSEARQQIIVGNYTGENLAGAAPSNTNIATDGPKGWWEEKAFWNNNSGTCQANKVCGHYTQMVWSKTTEVGCGLNRKSSVMGDDWRQNSAYLSCVYNPGGNISNQKPF